MVHEAMNVNSGLKLVTGSSEGDEAQTLAENRALHLREDKTKRNSNNRLKWGGGR